jgi:hypothetical protein
LLTTKSHIVRPMHTRIQSDISVMYRQENRVTFALAMEPVADSTAGRTVVRKRESRVWRLAVPGILLAIGCLLPFLNKAFTNDDPWFLSEARQILKTPLQPMSFPVCWSSTLVCVEKAGNMGPGAAQALMGYLLVPAILAGGSEWIVHLLQLLLLCLAVTEMVRLALRLGFERMQAAAAGMMLVAFPPVLAAASTAMPEIAALALGLTGLERLLAWRDDRRWQQAALAALALGLAPYARPHMVLLMPLASLWLLRDYRIGKALEQLRRDAYLWSPVVVAACILATVNLVTQNHGPSHDTRDTMIGTGLAIRNLRSYFQYLAFPLPFAAVWLTVRWRKSPVLLIAPAIPIVLHHFLADPTGSLLGDWPWFAAAYGLVAVLDMLYRCWRFGDWCNRLLSLWVLFPLVVAVFYPQVALTYLVPCTPAVALLLISTLAELARARAKAVSYAVVFACGAFGCLLLIADADFAECGRRAVAELITPRVAAGEKVWYGGIMGFYWYAQEAGAKIAKPGQPGPSPGELLVTGEVEMSESTLKRFPNRELIDSRRYKLAHGRTAGYGGALYSNGFGDAPWVWRPEATNLYEVWRVH